MPWVNKRALGISFQYGGEEHRGWLPPGAATPLPTPVRRFTLDLWIESEGRGYLLTFIAREDPDFGNDYWFEDPTEAEAAAAEWFGIEPDQWENS